MVEVDEVYDVEIINVGDRGDGIAKIDGLVIIVHGEAEIGKHVKIRISKVKEKFAFADIIED